MSEWSAQVHILGAIYSFAWRIIIWLGPETSDNHFDTLVAWGTGVNEKHFRWIESLRRIAERSWFSRVWVTQGYPLS